MTTITHETCHSPLCSRRETCTLWFNAIEAIEKGDTLLSVVNPKIIDEAGGYDHCPPLPRIQAQTFCTRTHLGLSRNDRNPTPPSPQRALIGHFGYSAIVRLRCGYDAISPEEQAAITLLFERLAPGIEPRYKAFEEHYLKPPRVEGKAAHKLLK